MAGIFVATLISTISMSLVVVVPSSLTFACSHFPYCAGQSRYLCSSKNSSSVKNAFPVTMDGSFYDYECRFNWSMKVECRLGILLTEQTCPLSWIVLIFVLIFGSHGGSTTGKDSSPSFGLGRVNSICDGTTFIEICPFSSRRCQTWWRLRHRAWSNKNGLNDHWGGIAVGTNNK